jgi:hypothetical protein
MRNESLNKVSDSWKNVIALKSHCVILFCLYTKEPNDSRKPVGSGYHYFIINLNHILKGKIKVSHGFVQSLFKRRDDICQGLWSYNMKFALDIHRGWMLFKLKSDDLLKISTDHDQILIWKF